MNTIFRIFAYSCYAAGMTVFAVFPANKYGWMTDMDPVIAMLPTDESSDSRSIFKFLMLILIVTTQLALVIGSASKRERLISIILLGSAVVYWLFQQ